MSYESEVLADAPLLYWRLGEASGTAAADTSGNSHPGTYSGGVTLGSASLVGGTNTSATFDGVDGAVSSDDGFAPTTYPEFTIEVVFKPTALTGFYHSIAGLYSAAFDDYIEVFWQETLSQPALFVDYFVPAGSAVAPAALVEADLIVLQNNTTYHIAGVYDGTNLILYVNGSAVATVSAPQTPTTSFTDNFWVGNDPTSDPTQGVIDEAAFYTSALSPTRVMAHAVAAGLADAAVEFTTVDNALFGQASPQSFTVRATGTPTPSLAVTGTLPPGVTFTDLGNGTASLAGTVPVGNAGSYPLTITATSGANTANQDFDLTVSTAVVITLDGSIHTATLEDLVNDTDYVAKIRGLNAHGWGDYSVLRAFTPAATLLGGSGGATPEGNPAHPNSLTWGLVLDEGFDGSSLDSGTWTSGLAWSVGGASYGANHNEAQFYTPGCVTVSGGSLKLTAKRQSYTFDGVTKSYQSGCINSCGKFDFNPTTTPTYIEASVKLDYGLNGVGLWPAFWLLKGTPGNFPWPPEVDIFENFGTISSPIAHLHTINGDINQGESFGTVNMAAAFHTFGVLVSATSIKGYLDGVLKWTYSGARVADAIGNPMYLILNLAVGQLGGDPSGQSFPADMQVDWLRVWQGA